MGNSSRQAYVLVKCKSPRRDDPTSCKYQNMFLSTSLLELASNLQERASFSRVDLRFFPVPRVCESWRTLPMR